MSDERIFEAFSHGSNSIDSLTRSLSWTGTFGQSATVRYTFNESFLGDDLMNDPQKASARAAMEAWSNIANVTFVRDDVNYDLAFSQPNLPEGIDGLASYVPVGNQLTIAEVQIDSALTGFTPGKYAYLVLLHEIGHALGLKHPGAYSSTATGPFLPDNEDSEDATVMSYYSGPYTTYNDRAQTPMIYDVAAIQYLYGANRSYNSGNDTYSYTGRKASLTIWDGGGKDMLDASGYNSASTIDLREGLGNVSVIGQTAVWIARGASIENAKGGVGMNTIYGNNLNNVIYGMGNSDTLYGYNSNDTIYGGSGSGDPFDLADTIYGGNGADVILGNGGNDLLYGGHSSDNAGDLGDAILGGKGNDIIYGNLGDDLLYGGGGGSDPSDGMDTIYGGQGNDALMGNGNNDVMYGGDGSDRLIGGQGNDIAYGEAGSDHLYGLKGNDTLSGGAGNDFYYFGADGGADRILEFEGVGVSAGDTIVIVSGTNGITSAASALSFVSYGGGSATLNLGGGSQVVIAGIGGGFTVDDFLIA